MHWHGSACATFFARRVAEARLACAPRVPTQTELVGNTYDMPAEIWAAHGDTSGRAWARANKGTFWPVTVLEWMGDFARWRVQCCDEEAFSIPVGTIWPHVPAATKVSRLELGAPGRVRLFHLPRRRQRAPARGDTRPRGARRPGYRPTALLRTRAAKAARRNWPSRRSVTKRSVR